MIDRRRLLASAAAGAGFAALPPVAFARADEDARLDAILSRQFEEDLNGSPTSATSLGLDVGTRAGQRAQLDDRSLAAARHEAVRARERLEELRTIDPSALSVEGRASYDVLSFQKEVAAEAAAFGWHTADSWRRTPYVVSQINGSYIDIPSFLDTTHPVKTREDADAFIERLKAFPASLDGDTERSHAHSGMGMVAPDFILDKAIAQLAALRDQPGADQAMVRSLAHKMGEAGIEGDHVEQAAILLDGPVKAALERQIVELRRQRVDAVHDAGIGGRPDGPAYYALNLKAYTTTASTAAEIHELGLEQVADIQAQADVLLKSEGYTQGSVAERMAALRTEARFLWPNTDAGRADLLTYVNAEMDRVRARTPEIFARVPTSAFLVQRVPAAIEAGAPGGYAQGGSLDGSRPGIYFINLKDTADWPRWTLKTLTYHEAAPGHLFEGALALQSAKLPLYRKTVGFSAYGEGWGLYAERLADELGLYEGDPFGRIGYLESFLFRACRLVVDTGLHSKGWSREQAIRYMTENVGDPNEPEIDRYCSAPGQACSYKMGEIAITGLREELKRASNFDLKRFHSAVLDGGRMPLTVLEQRVRAAFA
ncbi:DUF885 family protein [Brevundimonas sp. NIBR11]|uniref:DUF885 domain-containing protein n=1 Tax=Brevundimonas sp. NIBR11 TaxID=3015999 RepID=UPI0022F0F02F|nr:DUF885 family protein [Brevundimonas sp. NIBR11]WGM30194.1 hypothetical protein KKHFBJBL_00410 [Brevundimonas sp. NIBR11]